MNLIEVVMRFFALLNGTQGALDLEDGPEIKRIKIAPGGTLRAVRLKNGLTQTEMAKILGCNCAQTISQVERGQANLHKRHLKPFNKRFGPAKTARLIDEMVELKWREMENAAGS